MMPEARRATAGLAALGLLALGGTLLAAHEVSPLLGLPLDAIARYCGLAWTGSSVDRAAADVPVVGLVGLALLLAGSTFALARLARRLWGLQRIERLLRAVPDLAGTPAAARLRARAAHAGLPVMPRVADLGGRPAAFTVGLVRPRIAVSPAVVDALTDTELDALLLHEAAHARRRDPLRLIVAGFCRDLLFFLPVSHVLFAVVREAQEHAADDTAAERAGPLEVAAALIAFLRVAGRHAAPRAVSAAAGANPEARIRRLLDGPAPGPTARRPPSRTVAALLASGVIVAGLLAIPGGVSHAALAGCCTGASAAVLLAAASC